MYLALDKNEAKRQAAFRSLLRTQLDKAAMGDIRTALNQNKAVETRQRWRLRHSSLAAAVVVVRGRCVPRAAI